MRDCVQFSVFACWLTKNRKTSVKKLQILIFGAIPVTLLSGSSGAGEARSVPLRAPTASNAASWAEARRSWLFEVETAVDVAQLRALLLRMYDAVQTLVSSASDGGAADVEWSDAWHRELTQAW